MQGRNRFVVSEAGAGPPWWLEDGRLVYPSGGGALMELWMTSNGPTGPGSPRAFKNGAVVCVARSGAVLVSRAASPLAPPVVTIEAWQDIWRILPPAIANLPR
jgi:hypothetical protein